MEAEIAIAFIMFLTGMFMAFSIRLKVGLDEYDNEGEEDEKD